MGNKVTGILEKLFSLPKTVYFNFRCLDFRTACRLPVLVHWRIRLGTLRRGCVTLVCPPSRFLVKIGFGEAGELSPRRGRVTITGQLRLNGRADLGAGIILASAGVLSIGGQTYINADCTLWCDEEILLGEDARLGWGVVLRDSDGHPVMDGDRIRPFSGPIRIGCHCWLCSESAVLKGAELPEGSILGYRAVLTKAVTEKNALYAGTPARMIRQGVYWPRGEDEKRVRRILAERKARGNALPSQHSDGREE